MNDESDFMEITRFLEATGQGDLAARDLLANRVYEELKRTAVRLMKWEPRQTLQPTALVNEVYLRLFEQANFANSPNRAYFFAAASQAMKRILVEAARRRKSIKRGGQYQRQPLDDVLDQYESQNIDLNDLDEALLKLEVLSPRQASVVHLRCFIELPIKEIAEILGVSVSTVEQDWRSARAFLKRQFLFP
jgi:RNA polymerase sigma factor (TIGR02999 family)